MKNKKEEKEKSNQTIKTKITPWICCLLGSLDIAMMLLDLLSWCISPESPQKFSAAGQCESLSLPLRGQLTEALQCRSPSSTVGGAFLAQKLNQIQDSPLEYPCSEYPSPQCSEEVSGSSCEELNRLELEVVPVAYRRDGWTLPLPPMPQLCLGHWHPLITSPSSWDI